MGLAELLLIAVSLSMDAFAVAVSAGLTMPKTTIKNTLTIGLYFGAFQAIMPIAGYLLANRFADSIEAYGHWIAFVFLSIIGGKMIFEALNDRMDEESVYTEETAADPVKMLTLAVATSIDALAVGVSFAFLRVSIIPAAAAIGITTLVLSIIGVKVGNAFGMRFKAKAELAGGVILMLIGLKILLENTGIEFLLKACSVIMN